MEWLYKRYVPTLSHSTGGLSLLSTAIYGYLEDIANIKVLCGQYEANTAIHDRGRTLQVYRLYERHADTARSIRDMTQSLPSWKESLFWETEYNKFEKLERDVTARMKKHEKLHPIATRGVSWERWPMLVHAYKFEPDPVMKVELVIPKCSSPLPELPVRDIVRALQCHSHLVPECVAKPLDPWTRHEAKFSTISEYLSRTMPDNLYATQCFQKSPSENVDA